MDGGTTALLLLLVTVGTVSPTFYGNSISFMPLKKNADGTVGVTFAHRQNGRSSCSSEASLECGSGLCTGYDQLGILQTDKGEYGDKGWCQTEELTTATVSTNDTYFTLSGSGCCWYSKNSEKSKSPNSEKSKNWRSEAQLNLGTRSDTLSLNNCPVSTTVANLRVPQTCSSRIKLLAQDPDRDNVKCRFSPDTKIPSSFTIDEETCTLTSTGEVDTGVHVIEIILEDFPTNNITLTYGNGTSVLRKTSDVNSAPLCRVTLQFLVDISVSIPCFNLSKVQPLFLSTTPSHGDVLHASVGQPFELYAEARVQNSRIIDFQVSGPQNISKEFKTVDQGTAEVTITWTPQSQHAYAFVPFCFTAETEEIQSEMRCVTVLVTPSSIVQGEATVECLPNMMKVILDKASMPGIDERFLKLRDPSCSLFSNATHIMGTMSLSTCGTTLEDVGDKIAFKNEINSFVMPEEIITRRKVVKIGFSCQFPKSLSISNYFNIHSSDYIFTESGFGSFSYTFEIFKDNKFQDKVDPSDYPVEVRLLETVYMGIKSQSEIPNVRLFVESCKATPDDNPKNVLSYDLIKDGCIKDETLKIYKSEDAVFNFEVQAFKFTGNYDKVYITCSVIMCENTSPYSRCAQGCVEGPPKRRRRRDTSRETESHDITQGPFKFIEILGLVEAPNDTLFLRMDDVQPVNPKSFTTDIETGQGNWNVQQMLWNQITTVLFASAFIVLLVFIAVGFCYLSKRGTREDRKALILGLEN